MAWTIAWTGVQLAIIVILAVGAWRVDEGLLEVSSLIAFLLYAFGLMGPITELTQQITALQSGIAAAARIRDVDALALEEDAPPTAAAGAPPAARSSRCATSHAAYDPERAGDPRRRARDPAPRAHRDRRPVRRGQDDALQPDPALPRPAEGRVELDGRPYESYSHADVRDRLAYVEQETPVVPGTIRENVLLGRPEASAQDGRGRDARRAARAARPRHAALVHQRLRR